MHYNEWVCVTDGSVAERLFEDFNWDDAVLVEGVIQSRSRHIVDTDGRPWTTHAHSCPSALLRFEAPDLKLACVELLLVEADRICIPFFAGEYFPRISFHWNRPTLWLLRDESRMSMRKLFFRYLGPDAWSLPRNGDAERLWSLVDELAPPE